MFRTFMFAVLLQKNNVYLSMVNYNPPVFHC